ncbi:MAG: hypothetical protein AVDCRST_MAG85-2676, partial [uncultured Solirubrobacteraceae bacterium]
ELGRAREVGARRRARGDRPAVWGLDAPQGQVRCRGRSGSDLRPVNAEGWGHRAGPRLRQRLPAPRVRRGRQPGADLQQPGAGQRVGSPGEGLRDRGRGAEL